MPGKMARSGPQRQLDGLEYRELAGPSVLCLPAIQKIPNFHVSSGFIWGIPGKESPGHAGAFHADVHERSIRTDVEEHQSDIGAVPGTP